jgi:hypothetical protein
MRPATSAQQRERCEQKTARQVRSFNPPEGQETIHGYGVGCDRSRGLNALAATVVLALADSGYLRVIVVALAASPGRRPVTRADRLGLHLAEMATSASLIRFSNRSGSFSDRLDAQGARRDH